MVEFVPWFSNFLSNFITPSGRGSKESSSNLASDRIMDDYRKNTYFAGV
ncbi:MAG: hypothetical protein QNJ51_13490 [Calothrix sp. MO_167.B12]|nr:hypothetical protein [Calothrix sp. MO_167.B12]